MKVTISPWVRAKLLRKHAVTAAEVEQCFRNRDGGLLEDTRERNRSNPPTQWFVAPTNRGRLLKVVFNRRRRSDNEFHIEIRTAYEPNAVETWIYQKYGRR